MTTIRDIYSDIYEPIEFAYKKVKFKECYVAGLSFHVEKDDEMWDELCVGTKLALVRDKDTNIEFCEIYRDRVQLYIFTVIC